MSSNTLQNVVVVGAAAAGLTTAQSVAKSLPDTHRVVLIEANPVAYWSIAALRGAVLPGFEDQVVHELSAKTVFGAGSRHVVLTGTRVVDLGIDHVVVSSDVTSEVSGSTLDAEGRTKIPLDRAVLGLGSDYGFPTRAATTAKSADDIKAHFIKMQNDVKNAQDILVIGGGPTGVEFVGEVLDVHPNKKITLLTRGAALASSGDDAFAGMSKKLLSQLQAKGVRVILNDSIPKDLTTGPIDATSFTTSKGVELTAEYVMVALGGRPNTEWVKSSHPELVDSKGYLKVTDAFVLDAPGWERYYSLGDAANTPGLKTNYIATQHAPLVAHNVVAAIKGTSTDKLKRVNGAPGALMVVPIGKGGGAGYLGFATVGSWVASFAKGKTLFVPKFHGSFKA